MRKFIIILPTFFLLFLNSFIFAQSTIFEAENAVLTGVITGNTLQGFSGTGYMDANSFNDPTDQITFNVNVTNTGSYPLSIRYFAYSDKSNIVSINGSPSTIVFTGNSAWDDLDMGNINLNAGDNTIEIKVHWGWIHVDYIEISGITGTTTPTTSTTPPTAPSNGNNNTSDLWIDSGNNSMFTNYDRIGIGTGTPTKFLHVHAPNPDDGLQVSAEGKSTLVRLQVAGGDYGYLALGGETKLRGNGERSHFMGRLGVGITHPEKAFHVHAPSPDNGLQVSAEGKSTKVHLLIADGDYGYLALGGETKLRGNGERSHFMGRLGVGTSYPSKALHVHAPSPDDGLQVSAEGKSTLVRLQVAGGDYGYLALGGDTKLRGNGQVSEFEGRVKWGNYRGLLSTDQGASLELGGAGTPYIDFMNSTGSDHDMRIMLADNNTLVIRGKNSGQERLVVEGKISAQEVRISSNGWADYVFNENYNLKTLEEVEAFIAENGHLPNIPSEETIVKEGLNVSELITIQQEKIEELFLYLIELNKKIEQLTEDNQELSKELNQVSIFPIQSTSK